MLRKREPQQFKETDENKVSELKQGKKALDQFISDSHSQTDLIVSPSAVLPYLLPQLPQGYEPTPQALRFIPQHFSLPTFQYLLQTARAITLIQAGKKYLPNLEFIQSVSIEPTLCKNNVLYEMKKGIVRQISLDANHPRFVSWNMLTRKATPLAWEEVQRMITAVITKPQAAQQTLSKLEKLYATNQHTAIPQVLPSFKEVYTAHALSSYAAQIRGEKDVPGQEDFLIPATLCENNQIIAKKGISYYCIKLSENNITYQRLTNGHRTIMKENELDYLLYELRNSNAFKEQTGVITSYIKEHYKQNVLPAFREKNQLSVQAYNRFLNENTFSNTRV